MYVSFALSLFMFNNLWTKNISLNLSIFSFTNIEIAQVITSAFKSSMEILLFQWSQVSKHPDWKPHVNAWKDFKPSYILENIWEKYIHHVTSEHFTRCLQSGAGIRANKFTVRLPRILATLFCLFRMWSE
jgi:hypothetical protein